MATRRPSGAQAKLTAAPQNTLVGQCQMVAFLPRPMVTMRAMPFGGARKMVSGPFRAVLATGVACDALARVAGSTAATSAAAVRMILIFIAFPSAATTVV